MPLVSVIMPVHNAIRFLRKSVDSVLNQTYNNLELIIIDDCSNDGSTEAAKECANLDSRVRVIVNSSNKGVAETRNVGIREAKGKYIALLDSDDIWDAFKLEKQVELIEKENAQIAYCSYGFINENDVSIKKSFIVPEYTDFGQMLKRCVISCSTALIDADIFKKYVFTSEYYHEDYVMWMKLLKNGAKAVGDKTVLAHYRQVSGSRSSNKIRVALYRWEVYRKALKLPFFKSCICFIQYAYYAIIKYYF